MTDLSRAIRIAVDAHDGQSDKAGQPYILHVLHVLMQMPTDELRIIAALHDVIEDGAETIADLRAEGFSEQVLSALDAISRMGGERYSDYIDRVAKHPLARKVKLADLADLEHNSNLSRIKNCSLKDLERTQKYIRAWNILRLVPTSAIPCSGEGPSQIRDGHQEE